MTKKITIQDELTDFILYNDGNSNIKVEVFLHNENIWLTQERIALLFGVQRPAITKHLKNIYESNELTEDSTSSILEHMGNNKQIYKTKYYTLDAILSVGYRVNSIQATQFRIWATKTLREYIIKGFTIDDDRLKNGQYFGKDYFQELLERVRSIRSSERIIYQKITDIFAECSIDYDKNSPITKEFYATIQNKFHYAITGKTSAEIIYNRVDKNKDNMNLTNWKNSPEGRILKSDTNIAKNYLQEKEIKELERTIGSYFDYIERIIEKNNTFTMEEFKNSVNKFLEFNEYEILDKKGTISKKQADNKAYMEYDIFNKTQKINSDFDKELIKKTKK